MAETVRKNLGMVTAYAYAVSKGYSGTEEEFAELMASYADVAQDAETSAQAAAQSATTAEQKATQAAGSATNAAVSATSASESAQTAAGSSNSASLYAQNASVSATNAAGSASSASTYAGNASASAQAAEGFANAAQASATQAAGSADDAEAAKDLVLGMNAVANTLPAGSQATASYSNGTLTLGIPRGEKGEKGNLGESAYDQALEGGYTGSEADFIEDLNSIGELKENIPYIEQNTVGNSEKTGTTFIISEAEPRNFSNASNTQGTIHGANRFNIALASFSMSGYSGHYTITKQNNGIKIETDITSTSSAHYAYTEYTAEYTGTLYLSCKAKLISGDVRTLIMALVVNGTTIGRVYGEGSLYIAANVTANDIVQIRFYGHAQEDVASTSAYENIMLAYGGLYPFVAYKADTPTGNSQNVYTEKELSDYISEANYGSTPKAVSFRDFMMDATELPLDNNTVARDTIIICDETVPLTDYNTLYYDTNMTGIAVSRTGVVIFRISGLNKSGMTTWLTSHPLIVKYKTGEITVGGDISPDVFQQGIILTYSESQTIKYDFTERDNKGTLVCFGDSITGMFTGKTAYTDMIDMMSEYNTINCGFSGTGYCDHTSANYLPFSANRLIQAVSENDYTLQDASPLVDPNESDYDPLYAEHLQNLKGIDFGNVDYVSFFYGTNDWGANKILLSSDDTSTDNKQRTNVQDAVIYCVGQLLTKYPHLRVIVITPYWRSKAEGEDSNVDPNSNGAYLYEFADKIAEFASTNFNVPTINLYRSFGANAITNRYFTKDGTHPTEMGKRIIAKRIVDCLNNY